MGGNTPVRQEFPDDSSSLWLVEITRNTRRPVYQCACVAIAVTRRVHCEQLGCECCDKESSSSAQVERKAWVACGDRSSRSSDLSCWRWSGSQSLSKVVFDRQWCQNLTQFKLVVHDTGSERRLHIYANPVPPSHPTKSRPAFTPLVMPTRSVQALGRNALRGLFVGLESPCVRTGRPLAAASDVLDHAVAARDDMI